MVVIIYFTEKLQIYERRNLSPWALYILKGIFSRCDKEKQVNSIVFTKWNKNVSYDY